MLPLRRIRCHFCHGGDADDDDDAALKVGQWACRAVGATKIEIPAFQISVGSHFE
jgi:hypothetical protein